MKMKFPSRSMLALGLGCTLATLPLAVASAQDSSSTSARASGGADATKSAAERPKLSGDEQKFMMEAAAGNAAEVKLAEVALKNSENADVKKFAHQMIADHGKANKELAMVAQRENITDFKPEPNAEQKALCEKMMAMKGKEFDEAYIKNAVADHSKDLDDYKQAHNDVSNKDLLAYVKNVEPIVAGHLKMAKMMEKGETKE